MVEEQAYTPPVYKPLPRTHTVIVTQTHGHRFNAYRDGVLLVSEATKPVAAAAARALLLEFGGAPDDTVVFKVGGVSGDERPAVIKRLGELAGTKAV